jgi:hypothetical protein
MEESFIQSLLDRMEKIRNEEFMKNGYTFQEFEKKEKEFRECRMELRDYQQKMRKQVILNRGKSARNEFIEHETVVEGCDEINIFEDDLFQIAKVDENGQIKEEKKEKVVKKKASDYTDEELREKIETYIKKKNIELDKKQRKDLEEILMGEKDWKKYLEMNKEGDILKIGFIKKGEYRDVKIEMADENKMSKEEMKTIQKRKNLLKQFKN